MEKMRILFMATDPACRRILSTLSGDGRLSFEMRETSLPAALSADLSEIDGIVLEVTRETPLSEALQRWAGLPVVLIAEPAQAAALAETAPEVPCLVKDPGMESLLSLPSVLRSTLHCHRSREQLTLVARTLDELDDSVVITDDHGTIQYVNASFEKLTGFTRDEVIGQKPSMFKSGKHEKEFYISLWKKISSGHPFHAVFADKSKDGNLFYIEQTVAPIRNGKGEIARFVSSGHDVSANIRMEQALQEANEKLIAWVDELEQRGSEISLLSEMADMLQTCLSSEEAYAVIAQSVQKLFPNDSGALCMYDEPRVSLNVVSSWGNIDATRHTFAPSDCWSLRRGKMHVCDGETPGMVCKHVDESQKGGSFCVPLLAQNESMGILFLKADPSEDDQPKEFKQVLMQTKQRLAVTVAEHIALALANIRLRDTLRNQAIRDPLTNLFNRRYMEETLEREMHKAKRESKKIGIIMIDIDFFKKFNDTYGHAAGDATLRELGKFLRASVRGGDVACRYGGEEFILILPGASLDESAKRAEFMRREAQNIRVQLDDGKVLPKITLSIGVADYPEHGTSVDALLHDADAALYRAKAGGRNQVVLFDGKDEGKE